MPPRLGVAVQVIHFAGEALCEPVLQMGEAVSCSGRGDAGELEAEDVGLVFDALASGIMRK